MGKKKELTREVERKPKKGVKHVIDTRLSTEQDEYIQKFRQWQLDSISIKSELVSGPI